MKLTKILTATVATAFAFSAISASAATVYTRDLTVGSTGADVSSLQTTLESKGFLVIPASVSKGYFGSLTKTALAKYQASVGIAPALGFFGPITRVHLNGVVVTPNPTGGNSSGSGLSGGEGDIKNFKVLGNPGDEDLDEGESKDILGFEFEAKGSDLRVERVDVFAATTSKPWKVVESARLMYGGKEIAEVSNLDSKGEWDEESDDVYSFRFSIDKKANAIVEEGEKAKFYVELTAQDAIDSDEEGDIDFYVPDDGIRVIDAEGIYTYAGADSSVRTVTFGEAASGDLEIKIDGSDNEDRTIFVDENSSTDGVEILRFTIEGDESDVTIDELSVELAKISGLEDLSDVIKSLTLEVDGDEIASESIDSGSGNKTVTFEDLEDDFEVADGDEIEVVVYADFDEQDGNYAEGFAFEASVDASAIDAEDAAGDTASVSGDVTGGEIEVRVNGLNVEFDSASATEDAANDAGEYDTGTYTIRFDVSANGDDVYVSGASFAYTVSGNAVAVSEFDAVGGDYDEETNTWKVADGDIATFELTVELTSNTTTSTSQRVTLTGINWDTSDVASTTQVYDQDLGDFKTKALFLGGK